MSLYDSLKDEIHKPLIGGKELFNYVCDNRHIRKTSETPQINTFMETYLSRYLSRESVD